MELPVAHGLALVGKAREKTRDEHIWMQWAIQLPVMGLGGETVSFKAYRDRLTGANIDRRTTADLLREVQEIEKKFEEVGNDGNGNI